MVVSEFSIEMLKPPGGPVTLTTSWSLRSSVTRGAGAPVVKHRTVTNGVNAVTMSIYWVISGAAVCVKEKDQHYHAHTSSLTSFCFRISKAQ